MPDDDARRYIGNALKPPDDPESNACHAAWQARYAECIAEGMREREAQIEGAKASARCRRVQLGLEPDAEDFYVEPKDRLRLNAKGELVAPKSRRR